MQDTQVTVSWFIAAGVLIVFAGMCIWLKAIDNKAIEGTNVLIENQALLVESRDVMLKNKSLLLDIQDKIGKMPAASCPVTEQKR